VSQVNPYEEHEMKNECVECGISYPAKKKPSKFCSTPCRKSWNNRRATRGALLYDTFMAMRYDRAAASAAGIDYRFLCRVGEMFHNEDKDAGRTSFRSVTEVSQERDCQVNARVYRCG
jgi:hypothetical protein